MNSDCQPKSSLPIFKSATVAFHSWAEKYKKRIPSNKKMGQDGTKWALSPRKWGMWKKIKED
jgi:transposase